MLNNLRIDPNQLEVDDFNKIKYCKKCKRRVDDLFPETCPFCKESFESRWDFFFRMVAYVLIISTGIYLWQKVLIGF